MFISGTPVVLIFRVNAGILVRVVVTSTPPPGSGGRSLLLIRAADPPSRISRHSPPIVVLLSGVVKSLRSDHLSPPPTIRATCMDILCSTSCIYLPHGHNCHRRSTIPHPSPCGLSPDGVVAPVSVLLEAGVAISLLSHWAQSNVENREV